MFQATKGIKENLFLFINFISSLATIPVILKKNNFNIFLVLSKLVLFNKYANSTSADFPLVILRLKPVIWRNTTLHGKLNKLVENQSLSP